MVRILSAAVLIPVFFGGIWLLPSPWLLAVAEVVLLLAFVEYVRLAEALGARGPRRLGRRRGGDVRRGRPGPAARTAAGRRVVGLGALIVGSRAPAPGVLGDVSAAVFPVAYLGLPLGSFVALHAMGGRETVVLLLLTIVVSDSAQYFTGRLLGRHSLSPVISPKKTLEGALGGFVIAPAVMALVARWWLPDRSTGWVLLVGLVLVGFGIAGDLFESLLKRSAGVKDSSALIPGHGGVLDRIDAMLFAAPVFYVLLKYAG